MRYRGGAVIRNVQLLSDVDALHQPAERAGGITPWLEADGGQHPVDIGLGDIGHVGKRRDDIVG